MKKPSQFPAVVVATIVFALNSSRLAAQGPPGGGNFDPQQFQQQMQQRIAEALRQQFDVPNDDEWKIIQERVMKVIQVRMDMGFGGMGFIGLGGMRRGGGPGNPDGGNNPGGMRRGFPGFGGQPDPEAQALQTAIESKAPVDEVKAKLAKYRDARKQKEANLAKAQDDLRQVLSVRQEATAVLLGLLP